MFNIAATGLWVSNTAANRLTSESMGHRVRLIPTPVSDNIGLHKVAEYGTYDRQFSPPKPDILVIFFNTFLFPNFKNYL